MQLKMQVNLTKLMKRPMKRLNSFTNDVGEKNYVLQNSFSCVWVEGVFSNYHILTSLISLLVSHK